MALGQSFGGVKNYVGVSTEKEAPIWRWLGLDTRYQQ